jgi:hypothetical protein
VTFERTYRALARSLGPTGFRSIVARALAQVQPEHPLLGEIRANGDGPPGLERVRTVARAHGDPAVAAGLESWLETILDLVGRLIGFDVVAQLVEQTAPASTHADEDDK